MARYTQLTQAQVSEAVQAFGVTARRVQHIDGGAANTSYRVTDAVGNEFVLTVLDNTINLSAQTLAELLEYLVANSVATSEPLRSTRGELVEGFEGHRIMLKRFVDGTCHETMPSEHLENSGVALGRVHHLAPPSFLPAGTRRLRDVATTVAAFDDREFAHWVMSNLERTCGAFEVDTPGGILHGDYFPDNLIIRADGSVAILDWETASVDVPIIDIGIAAVGLANTDGQFDSSRFTAFMRGYESSRPLQDDEREQLLNAVVFGATLLGYHRYLRHHIRFPDPAKQHLFSEMVSFAQSAEEHWAQG